MTVADKLRTNGATEKDASVFIGDTTYDLPMRKGTLGPDVVDISTLYQHTGRFTYDPGFTSTASCESQITFIDFDKGIVLYRGYPIEQLAEHSTFLEHAISCSTANSRRPSSTRRLTTHRQAHHGA